MNFHKNELINTTLYEFYKTFSCTLDTAEYVPEKYNKKIHKFIYKNMRKAFRKINFPTNEFFPPRLADDANCGCSCK